MVTKFYVLTTEMASASVAHNEVTDYEHGGLKVRMVGVNQEAMPEPLRYEFDNPDMAGHLRAYMRQVRPDVMHAWHLGHLSGSIIPAAKASGVPIVFTATDFWSVCRIVHLRRADTGRLCLGPDQAGVNCLRCFAARIMPPGGRKKFLKQSDARLRALVALSTSSFGRKMGYGKQTRAVVNRISFLKEVVNMSDLVLAPTRLTRDLLIRNGINPRLIRHSAYGIETSEISAAPRSLDRPPTLRFGYMGAITRHKGPAVLIRAFRDLPDSAKAELGIYGSLDSSPEYAKHLRTLAEGDRRISFRGAFESEKVGHILSDIDVLVVPSIWYENTPLVIYEAFASGTPVVATDLGGMSELVEHGRNGLLFQIGQVQDLNAQLARFLSDPDLLAKLRAGIGSVRTVQESVDELEQFYRELLARPPAIQTV